MHAWFVRMYVLSHTIRNCERSTLNLLLCYIKFFWNVLSNLLLGSFKTMPCYKTTTSHSLLRGLGFTNITMNYMVKQCIEIRMCHT